MNEPTDFVNTETHFLDKQVVEKLGSKVVILKSNSLIVNNRQKNNPVLKHIRNVVWEYGDINPDFQFGITSCALYLSIRYHNLNPEYIHDRFRQLANSYELRVLLVLVDVKDSHHPLKELSKICLLANCTLILAFSIEEAGKYLETYKSFENKPANLIMEKTESDFESQLADVLTSVRQVNKTDSKILFANIGSFSQIVGASENELAMCPGIGNLKAKKLFSTFHQPFLKY